MTHSSTSDPTTAKPIERASLGQLILEFVTRQSEEITEEDIAYFTQHPDQIDQVSSAVNLHKLFLIFGLLLGVFLVAVSKIMSYSGLLAVLHPGFAEFLIDIVFEIGVGLIGAAIVTFMLSVTFNAHVRSAKKWRRAIRQKIKDNATAKAAQPD